MKPLPMIYGEACGRCKVLYFEELDNGFKILITNTRGTHPCAYIMVPKEVIEKFNVPDDELYDYDLWSADVHGGFTYGNYEPPIIPDGYTPSGSELWLGWDYAHVGDYYVGCTKDNPLYSILYREPRSNEHVWTTEEIISEAHTVIETLEF